MHIGQFENAVLHIQTPRASQSWQGQLGSKLRLLKRPPGLYPKVYGTGRCAPSRPPGKEAWVSAGPGLRAGIPRDGRESNAESSEQGIIRPIVKVFRALCPGVETSTLLGSSSTALDVRAPPTQRASPSCMRPRLLCAGLQVPVSRHCSSAAQRSELLLGVREHRRKGECDASSTAARGCRRQHTQSRVSCCGLADWRKELQPPKCTALQLPETVT